MQYGIECNHIMNNLVPARGQADPLPENYPIDPDKTAYLEDNLYDYIADKTGKLYAHHSELTEYEHDPDMYR